MATLNKIDKYLKCVILGIFVIHLIAYFMPIFKVIHIQNDADVQISYSYIYYGSFGGFSWNYASTSLLLMPIIALTFLFANFKNCRVFFYGFSATYITGCIFQLLAWSKEIYARTSSYYEYQHMYGYNFYVFTLVLLSIVVVLDLTMYIVSKFLKLKLEPKNLKLASDSNIDTVKSKIELLNNLKQQGILTEGEYEQKRSSIIKELKL